MAGAQAIRLASYERDGQWPAALGAPGDRLVDAGAAARRAGLDGGVAWSSVRAIVAQDADRLAALYEAAGALADESNGDAVAAEADARFGPHRLGRADRAARGPRRQGRLRGRDRRRDRPPRLPSQRGRRA
jgi:hypothetical protein